MDLTTLFIIALAIVGLITALVQVLKTTLNLTKRYVPIVSVAVGILFGLLFQPLTDYNIYTMAVAGLIGGLAASGAFDLSKVVKGGGK
ncbi:hypothetical protein CSE16_11855 [Solibacillus sp. R5-41]|uniref:hypothetical protein n=1 Tax=Solibacillus sp. R5-41 TaxID=2048654 RepID=UPI000C1271BD|nr:hypothetical protein [Solibacillus sp. R5-41]ATP40686.1 hypothetical protein CSE16_11855 [Solibacillus sp. R5-41]